MSANEVAYAIALGKVEAEENELEEAISEVRRYLTLEPAGSFSDGVRQRLCSIRRQAGLPGAGASSPLEVGEGVEKPVAIYTPQPSPAPGEGRDPGKAESVEIQVLIDADGCVDSIEILGAARKGWSKEVWSKIVVRQVAHWVFRPATRDGRAVAVHDQITMSYLITGRH